MTELTGDDERAEAADEENLDDSDDQKELVSDQRLIDQVRHGDMDAFGLLWKRWRAAGFACALKIAPRQDAEDLVSEAFAKILKTIKKGGGPTGGFRPYLYTTIRNLAMDKRERGHREIAGLEDASIGVSTTESEVFGRLDAERITRVFYAMEPRQRELLWLSDVEDLSLKEMAEKTGLKPNNVGVIVHRARKSFVALWIESHVADNPQLEGEHAWVLGRIGDQLTGRGNVNVRDRVEKHLKECETCAALVTEVADVSKSFRSLIAPAVLGTSTAVWMAAPDADAATIVRPPQMPASVTRSTNWVGWGAAGAVAVAGIAALIFFTSGGVVDASSDDAGEAPVAMPPAVMVPVVTPTPTPVVTPSPLATPTPTTTPVVTPAPSVAPAVVPVSAPKTTRAPKPSAKPSAPATTKPKPAITIGSVSAGPGNVCYAVLSGTALPGSTITLGNGAKGTVTAVANASGRWTAPPLNGLPAGTRSVEAYDRSGKQTPDSAPVTLAKPPSLSITRTDQKVTVTVMGKAGMNVSLSVDGATTVITLGGSGRAVGTYALGESGPHTIVAAYHASGCEAPGARATLR